MALRCIWRLLLLVNELKWNSKKAASALENIRSLMHNVRIIIYLKKFTLFNKLPIEVLGKPLIVIIYRAHFYGLLLKKGKQCIVRDYNNYNTENRL